MSGDLESQKAECPFYLYGYCLSNQVHLLAEILDDPISPLQPC
jgi:hypothetical protein